MSDSVQIILILCLTFLLGRGMDILKSWWKK